MDDSRPAASVVDLVKTYGAKRAIDGLSLAIPEGSVFGLVGANGAGKTTLLSILAGLKSATSGQVDVLGKSPREAIVGFMPDSPDYYKWLDGVETLQLAAALTGGQMSEAEALDRLAMVGLSSAARARAGTYSRGMRQRLGLAATLVGDPRLIILDEPCSALDPLGRIEVLELIAGVRGTATVIFSSHLLSDIERICDRVALIDGGRLVAEGTVGELRKIGAASGFRLRLAAPSPELIAEISAAGWCLGLVQVRPGVFRIQTGDHESARVEILRALVRHSSPLVELAIDEPSLEDAFVRMVQGPEKR